MCPDSDDHAKLRSGGQYTELYTVQCRGYCSGHDIDGGFGAWPVWHTNTLISIPSFPLIFRWRECDGSEARKALS